MMRDPRIEKLARLLVSHSCALAPGELVVIESVGAPVEIVLSLIREAKRAGATPLVWLKDDRVICELASVYDEADVRLMADCELHALRQSDALISIRATRNTRECSDVPAERTANVLRHYVQPVHLSYRNNHLKWVALRWPTPALAQRAGMSTEGFENYFFDVCDVDYARMEAAMGPLAELIERTDVVCIKGPGETDLRFSVKGVGAYKSAGRHNVPDGELFTAPVRDSVEGRISFNTPSTYYGTTFEGMRLDFSEGRIVGAVANDTRRLNQILDQDEGARYVGEFAFGLHPRITWPVGDILFDEKIAGSLHLAVGNAYPVCDNGNRSAIHWDLILIQTEQMGGGSVYFDDALVRRDGLFVLPELVGLNPERLM